MQTQLPTELPETANFVRQVELNRTIEGVYPIAKFARLGEVLLSDEGFVTVKLEFTRSVGIASLRGKVSAQLLVECQRCLKPVETEVSGSFKFALVHSEDEFDLLPEEFEPYLLEDEEQSIIDLVEDELLLSLPMVTIHQEACSEFMSNQNEAVKTAIKAEKEAENPFAALKALKEELSNKAN
ncbi:MAG: DUF177 domain-containing protein [Gammaproteobacteria bacterium]|nr:DUF177 domain-containing protein [Gammaproteobacteria bacterium]MBT8134934.1 DUF177 domain-containing protein [Gammaproteobacteria bacterium]NNJ50533.1 hypothetical protein [Gammaproteobacteria bacterium]